MKLYPTLRYEDPRAAHEWLERVIGFEPVAMHEDGDGGIAHAEMRWGEDIVMFGSPKPDFPALAVTIYLTCEDPDSAYARATAEPDVEVARELSDTDYGSRDFMIRDPEGNSWSFGTYEPR